jgi:hypothetical protein
MNILLCLLFLAVSSIGQLNGQRTQVTPLFGGAQPLGGAQPIGGGYGSNSDNNIIIKQLGFLNSQLSNQYSMKRLALLGGPCFLCYMPVGSPLGHTSNKLLKRYCNSRLCN